MGEVAYFTDMSDRKTEFVEPSFRGVFRAAYRDKGDTTDIEAEDATAKDAKETLERNRELLCSALQKLLYPIVGLIRSFRSPDARIADKQARVLELIERLRKAMGVVKS